MPAVTRDRTVSGQLNAISRYHPASRRRSQPHSVTQAVTSGMLPVWPVRACRSASPGCVRLGRIRRSQAACGHARAAACSRASVGSIVRSSAGRARSAAGLGRPTGRARTAGSWLDQGQSGQPHLGFDLGYACVSTTKQSLERQPTLWPPGASRRAAPHPWPGPREVGHLHLQTGAIQHRRARPLRRRSGPGIDRGDAVPRTLRTLRRADRHRVSVDNRWSSCGLRRSMARNLVYSSGW
jgi:hypothetical protein